jgi:hypothetical protein
LALDTTFTGGAYTVGVIAAGTEGATTAVLGSIAAFIGGVGSGNNSLSNHTIAIRQSIVAVNLSLREIDCEPGSDDSAFGDLLQRANDASWPLVQVVLYHNALEVSQNRSGNRQKWSDDLALRAVKNGPALPRTAGLATRHRWTPERC